MMLLLKISFCLFATPIAGLSLTLIGMIIWFYKTRPPAETLPFFVVGTDSLTIQMLGIVLTYVGFMLAIFFGPLISTWLAIIISFSHYCVVCCIVSSEIVHFGLRFAYIHHPASVLEAEDRLMRAYAWLLRLALTTSIVILDFLDSNRTETFITQVLEIENW